MNDQMDMVMGGDTEEQADEVYNQILGEIGMNINQDIRAGDGEIAQQNAPISQADAVSILLSYL